MNTDTRPSRRARRTLPHVLLKLAVFCFLSTGSAQATMATVEQRIVADVMSTLPSDSTVTTRMNQLGADGLWSNLTYNQTSTTNTHLLRLHEFARAYKSPASIHHNSPALREKFLLGYDGWMTANPNHDNWWWRAIGYPMTLGEVMLVMRSELSAARINAGNTQLQRAYLPRSNVGLENTGVNRTDRAYGTMMRAILSNSGNLLAESFMSIGDTILFTTLEGMQPDGSYHQHEAQLYTGGYGKRFGTDIPKYGSYAAGTIYNYNPRQIRTYTDWLLDGTQWMLRGPIIDHSTLGRGIVNSAQSSQDFLFAAERTIPMAGDYRASDLETMRARLEADLDAQTADPALALSGNRMFWRSDYMTHHRPDFMASVRTASTRTVASEVINGQNLKGLHQSDGMLLINRRGDEYSGIMPVWDWQRLPGTTIEQAVYSLLPTQPNTTPNWLWGTSTHAGGVSDGSDGALSFLYARRNVSGRKSWFFIGDSIVALGSAINASAATSPVLTTLNQSFLETAVTYSAGGGAQTINTGTVTPPGLEWVHHDGTGYFFPGGQSSATIRAQEQSGILYDINSYGTGSNYFVQHIHDVFSLDINHGTGFTGGNYAYVVVPGLDAASMGAYPIGDLEILSNTSNIQAVKSVPNGLTMANFYGAGTVDGITVSHSCSIMVRDLGNTIEVTVSDPKQVRNGDLTIQIDRPTAGLIEADGEVTVDQFGPTLTLRVNMAGSTGRSLKAKFFTAPTAFTALTLSPVADSDVLDGSGNANFGTATTLRTKQDSSSGDWNEAYLKFDLSGIPGTPVAARLVLHPTSISTTPTLHMVAPVGNHAWTEGGITWNNRPHPTGPAPAPWLPRLDQPVRADVLGAVRDFTGAGGELSLWVAPMMQSDAVVSFASRHHATEELRPTLELVFQEPYGVDNSIGATVIPGEAQLNGWLIDGPAEVTIYWGTSDGGTDSESWENAINLGSLPGGTFSSTISNLVAGTTYYYRTFADGPSGAVSSSETSSFLAPLPATVQLGNLSQTYNATPRAVSVTTDPAGISVEVTYNGSTEVPTAAGSYDVVATIDDPTWWGNASGTLTVAKATPTVTTWPTASGITEWQALSASTLSGGEVTFLDSPLPGTFVFDSPSITPTAGTYTAAVSFVPADTANFTAVSGGQVQVAVAENLPPIVDAGPDQTVFPSLDAPWTPHDLGLRAWYDASDLSSIVATNGNVSQLNDKSGNGRHLTIIGSGSPKTGTDSINSLNAIRLNGNALQRNSFPVNSNGNVAIYTVAQVMGVTSEFQSLVTMQGTNNFQFDAGNNSAFNGRLSATNIGTGAALTGGPFAGPGTYGVLFNKTDGGVFNAWVDGTKRLADRAYTSNLSTSVSFRIGANRSANQWLNSRIGEVILTDDVSLETQQKIEGYLAHKWGTTANLPANHPYKESAPVTPGIFAALDGTVTDPEGNPTTTAWTLVDGPVGVTILNENSVSTTVKFTTSGVYTFRLTADDGFGTSFDEVVITVDADTSHTVTFDSNGGSPAVPATMEVTFGQNYGTLPTTTRSGFSFVGWFTESTGGDLVSSDSLVAIADDHTLHARWVVPPEVSAGANQTVSLDEATPWTPAEISSNAWYDAAKTNSIVLDSGKVSQWNDQSGNNRHAYQATGARQPAYLSSDPMVGNLPSIGNITASGQIGLTTPSMSARNIYVVTYYKDGSANPFDGYSTLFSGPGSFGEYRVMGNGHPTTPTADFIGTSNFNNAGTFKNGSTSSSITALPMAASIFRFKSTVARTQVFSLGFNATATDRDWQGRYSEWIFTDGSEDAATEKLIEGYLAHKWGLSVNLPADHPYKAVAPGGTSAVATLNGSANNPDNLTLTHQWSVVSGPGPVVFGDATALNTTATFTMEGSYVLRLTSSDGLLSSFDDVTITVGVLNEFSITYNPNGATSGTAPVDANSPYDPDATVTVLGQGDLVRTGHSFAGWNTTSDGSGTPYGADDTFTISGITTLFAIWSPNTYTVSFDANGGSPASPASIDVTFGETYGTLPTVSRAGFSFLGWFTEPEDGTAISDATTTLIADDHTLHAQWNALPEVDAGPNQTVALSELVPWSPAEITTAAWYDAADPATITTPSGNAVSQWNDKSGNNNHLAQGAAGNRPATGANNIGGLNTVTFNANNANFMDAANSATLNFNASGGMNSFIVFKTPGHFGSSINCVFGKGSPWLGGDSGAGYGLYYSDAFNHTYKFADGDSRTINLGTSYHNTPLLFSTTSNHATGAQAFRFNGGVMSASQNRTPPRTTDNIGDFRVGNVAPQYAGGPTYNEATRYANIDLGELILIPGVITDEDRSRVEGYLAHKWNQAENLPAEHPYKSIAPGTLAAIATLNGSATDAEGDSLTHTWSIVNGPASVAFANVSALATTATFTEEGIYTLRLTTSDGFGTSSDDVVITVGDAVVPNPFDEWVGGENGVTFTGDSNSDGIPDGMAWLLGAGSPAENAASLMPVPETDGGGLLVSFKYLVPAKRGGASLHLQHSRDLGSSDPWVDHTIEIPDVSGTVSGVVFVIVPDPENADVHSVQATVPTEPGGRVFVRLMGVF